VGYNYEQIQRAEARKKRGYNLKKKHLITIYMNFDPDQFDINEDYEKDWTKTSAALAYSIQADLIVDVDSYHMDAIDGLLKIREKLKVYRDKNSIIYAVLSQLNPKRWGGNFLAHTYDPYNLLNNYHLLDYLEQFRVNDYNTRVSYNPDNGLFIGRGRLDPIAIKFWEMITYVLKVEQSLLQNQEKEDLQDMPHYSFLTLIIIFMLLKENLNIHYLNIMIILMILLKKVVR
jgi:hypothetical protein